MNGKNISYDEAVKLLNLFDYGLNTQEGSHVTFSKQNCKSITLVRTQKEVKPYLIRLLQEIIKNG